MVSNSSFFGSYNQVEKPVSILPIGQSTVFVPEEDVFLTLSGQGKNKKDCGEFSMIALCKDHPKKSFHPIRHTCWRSSCPICYEKWAGREGKKASERLLQAQAVYKKAKKPLGELRHIVFSPPQNMDWSDILGCQDSFQQWRSKCNKVFRGVGVSGGAIIFHPYRGSNSRGWRLAPHFHVIGWGFLEASDAVYKRTGWVYDNKGRRDSLEGTFQYLLTHCGVPKDPEFDRVHCVTYFGAVSYNKMVIASKEIIKESVPCVVCGEDLHIFGVKSSSGSNEVDFTDDRGVYWRKRKVRVFKLASPRRRKKKYVLLSQLELMQCIQALYVRVNRDVSMSFEGFVSMVVSELPGEKYDHLRDVCNGLLEHSDYPFRVLSGGLD